MENLIQLFKALSDDTRLRLVMLLQRKSHCVCELTEILGLSQPKISKHLTKLKELGLVSTIKDSRYVYYQLIKDDETVSKILDCLEADKSRFDTLVYDESKEPLCRVDRGVE